MDWIQWLTTIGTLGAFSYIIHIETSKKIDELREEAKAQAARTDKLYEMFVNLLQDKRS